MTAPYTLSTPLTTVVGGSTATVLADRLGPRTVGDLLYHVPRRYAERGELTRLADLPLDEHVTVVAEVADARVHTFNRGRGRRLEVTLTDGGGRLQLVFFGGSVHHHKKELIPGRRGMFAGKVSLFNRRLQLSHPAYQLLDEDTAPEEGAGAVREFADRLLPIYPACKQLESWKIAKAVGVLLDTLAAEDWTGVTDPLPEPLRAERGLLPLPAALEAVHRPSTRAELAAGRQRLTWDEAFVLQTALARRRHDDAQLPAVPRVARPGGLLESFDARLPFTLTAGQRRVGEEIGAGLAAHHPMHRLLQGEVGSGKTLVALRAMLTVVDAGGQAVLLAPTEVLAQQHHRSLTAMLGDLAEGGLLGGAEQGTRVALLTGSTGAADRRRALLAAVSGEAGIVVGTHALIEDAVRFQDLGLVVVDEQHRFGVEQRDALRAKAERPPHLLVMTATPIPRTVAMTVFGDLETSVLDELPGGRSPLTSHVVPVSDKPHYLERAWQRVREEVAGGHQVYVVCPRIGDEETPSRPAGGTDAAELPDGATPTGEEGPDARRPPLAVLDVADQLSDGPLRGLRLETLHGRLPADTKDTVMRRFADGAIDVLVTTTVIEVGVNVPNATVMVVLDADRFGVSQLHQLRGRVGRGSAPGLCLLVTDMPEASAARARLDAVAGTTDGFALSRIDLEQRREGDVLGQAQSGGRSSLRMLRVLEDEDVIAEARAAATALVADDPSLDDHPALRASLTALLDAERASYLDKG